MCGIFFSLSTSEHVLPKEKTITWLRNRGPDNYHVHRIQLRCCANNAAKGVTRSDAKTVFLTFASSVLGLRGDHVTSQPLIDPESNSVLCWNGEAWRISGDAVRGNDTELVFQKLLGACKPGKEEKDGDDSDNGSDVGSASKTLVRLTNVISNITGPFSLVFYDGFRRQVFFTRDCLGRRSLLQSCDEQGTLRICSICDEPSSGPFDEVETDGLHMIDLSRMSVQDSSSTQFREKVIPWTHDDTSALTLKNPIPLMNRSLPTSQPPALTVSSPSVKRLETELRRSLETRIRDVPLFGTKESTKIAVLFSGGLDCTVLARLAHDILPLDEPIDLLNVSFENPRVVAALKAKSQKENSEMGSIYENCPDRITGRAGHAELQRVCRGRIWRFVAVDIPFTEFSSHREEVIRLMRPHNTEMDLSIACALYFASRGHGTVDSVTKSDTAAAAVTSTSTSTYTTPARVLLSGLGADELFAGYGRHGVSFTRNGFQGLVDEIDLDVGRLGKRNLGRDDRVISNWGREARFPYLDENFVSWATRTPVWERCGFGTAELGALPDGDGPSYPELIGEALDPEKKVLRLLALKLGMTQTAREKKRAIQFGSRTAKMENGRTKGTSII